MDNLAPIVKNRQLSYNPYMGIARKGVGDVKACPDGWEDFVSHIQMGNFLFLGGSDAC